MNRLRNKGGSAVVELALASVVMAGLMVSTVEIYRLITNGTTAALQVRSRTFQILEGIDAGSNGCGDYPIASYKVDKKEEIDASDAIEVGTDQPVYDYFLWNQFFTAIQSRPTTVAWIGHKIYHEDCR